MKIIILTDYCGAFYSSTTNLKALCTMDTEKLAHYFTEQGYNVCISSFAEINLQEDYSDTYVIYTSSEDYELKYKSFIEDVVLALNEAGAVVLPRYCYLRAHHNKCYMELMRSVLFPEQAKLLETKVFGTLEEFKRYHFQEKKYVIKAAYGAGSSCVRLAGSPAVLNSIAKRMSHSFYWADFLHEFRRRFFWREYHRHSLHRNKFIVQNYIENLPGDFKVLVYGDRYYALYRKNRENDFRASGGGRLTFQLPETVPEERLLSFAKEVAERLATPLCSLDIAYDGENFFLIEFQCICFGPYTAEKSDHYFAFEDGEWRCHKEACDLEKVFCEAIDGWIKQDAEHDK